MPFQTQKTETVRSSNEKSIWIIESIQSIDQMRKYFSISVCRQLLVDWQGVVLILFKLSTIFQATLRDKHVLLLFTCYRTIVRSKFSHYYFFLVAFSSKIITNSESFIYILYPFKIHRIKWIGHHIGQCQL